MSGWQEVFELLSSPLAPEWTVVGIGAVGLYFAIRAFRETRRQAKATEEQVAIMQRQFDAANRPYVIFKRFRMVDFEIGKEPVFYLHFVNSGRTAARDVRITFQIFIAPKTTIELRQVNTKDLPHNVPVIPPDGDAMPFTAWGSPLDADYVNAVKGNNMYLGAAGVVQYKDELGKQYGPYRFAVNYIAWAEPRPPDTEFAYYVDQ